MGRDTNRVVLKGTVAGAPESRSKASGEKAVTLRIATVERVQRNGEFTDFTNWHRVVCFGIVAEEAGALVQNDRVSIEGKLQTRKYEVEGKTSYITEVIAFDVEKLATALATDERNAPSRSTERPASRPAANPPAEPAWDENRPF
ncbi:single-stranded DNA-binding protein [Cupriavidus necator]|uniref:single-stranded DNA-binding protein n=1 Tax=Cupriavidus necator TaxID=106590 RepID=UPI003ED1734B